MDESQLSLSFTSNKKPFKDIPKSLPLATKTICCNLKSTWPCIHAKVCHFEEEHAISILPSSLPIATCDVDGSQAILLIGEGIQLGYRHLGSS